MVWYKNKNRWVLATVLAVLYLVIFTMVYINDGGEAATTWGERVGLAIGFVIGTPLMAAQFFLLLSLIWWLWTLLKKGFGASAGMYQEKRLVLQENSRHKRLLKVKELYDAGIYSETEYQTKLVEIKSQL